MLDLRAKIRSVARLSEGTWVTIEFLDGPHLKHVSTLHTMDFYAQSGSPIAERLARAMLDGEVLTMRLDDPPPIREALTGEPSDARMETPAGDDG